jgi:hypothetical protein
VDTRTNPLPYRSGTDAAADDARAMRRSLKTWTILCLVWVVGLGVWAAYLVALGYLVLRVLA